MKIWKLADDRFPEIPSAEEHGWRFVDGQIEPVWTEKDILLGTLVDLMKDETGEASENEDDYSCDSDESEESDSELIV